VNIECRAGNRGVPEREGRLLDGTNSGSPYPGLSGGHPEARRRRSERKAQLPLVSNAEDADLIKVGHEPALALKPADLRSFLVVSFRLPDSECRKALQQGLRALRNSKRDRLFLMSSLAERDWYAGDFAAGVRRYRRMIRQRRTWRYWRGSQRDFLSLGSSLEALGRYRDAERA
jgi:hypothetical protein